MKTGLYQPRSYRSQCRCGDLASFNVVLGESDLLVAAQKELAAETRRILSRLRAQLEDYIAADRNFLTSLSPVSVPDHAPAIVQEMALASSVMDVGPMAAVAGAISEGVARYLIRFSEEVIIENGGDNFLFSKKPVTTAVYAGASALSMKLGLTIGPHPEGISICTSSGTVGHSLSFGKADAVTVIARSGCLADAAATAIGNRVKSEADIDGAIEFVQRFVDILGLVIIKNDRVGIYGDVLRIKKI